MRSTPRMRYSTSCLVYTSVTVRHLVVHGRSHANCLMYSYSIMYSTLYSIVTYISCIFMYCIFKLYMCLSSPIIILLVLVARW